MSLTIRRVNPEEVDRLQQVARKTFQDAFAALNSEEDIRSYVDSAFTTTKLKAELNEPSSQFYFALWDEIVTGYLKINFAPTQTDINDPDSLEIERIYVLDEFQNRKVGHFMMEHVITIATTAKKNFIWLGVWERNDKAIRFYERCGFHRWKEHSFILGTDKQTDLIMRKDL